MMIGMAGRQGKVLIVHREFVSYRVMNAFHIGFDGIMEKLKLYCASNPPGVGKLAGMKLIRRLEELEKDDRINEILNEDDDVGVGKPIRPLELEIFSRKYAKIL